MVLFTPEQKAEAIMARNRVAAGLLLMALAAAPAAAGEELIEAGRVVAVSVMADDERYSAVVDRWPEAVPRLAGEPLPS